MRGAICVIGLTLLTVAAFGSGDPPFHPKIPKVWDDQAVATMELPLVQRDRSPKYMSSAEYYALKVRPIYRSYPVYMAGREPAKYRESLKQKEPEIIFDPAKLHTKEDWIRAGKLVFESDTLFFPAPPAPSSVPTDCKVANDGELLCFHANSRYYIRKKVSWKSAQIPALDATPASFPTALSSKAARGYPCSVPLRSVLPS